MIRELAHHVRSFAIAALCIGVLHSTPGRADNEEWRNYFTTRELRQPSSNRVMLESLEKVKPQAPFFLPEDAANKGGLFGADVSHWDFECDCPSGCEIDWRGLAWKQGIRFVYAEATRGVTSIDPTFLTTWQALKPLHDEGVIYRGAYHWLSSDPAISGASQALWFLKNVENGGLHLAHGLDFEPDYIEVSKDRYDAIKATAECKTKDIKANGLTKTTVYLCDGWYGQKAEVIATKIIDWINTVENNNQTAIIYTTSNYWEKMIADKAGDILATHGVWLARYLDPAQYPDGGIPRSTIAPTNKWGMPPLPKSVSYPNGSLYSSRTNWQFEQCGQFHQTVWTCKGKPASGPAPDKSVCETATTAVMDMNWYPSNLADFKSAFGIK